MAEKFRPMSQQAFDRLEFGDIVQHANGETWMVTGNYGTHIAAVRTVDMTHRAEWRLLYKASYTDVSGTTVHPAG